ncbi:hypothetical protein ACTI_21610 [Actinoplanes sp. OR16]|uniref:hypothetical protein n=1 Tax=Actinoplanes sp. OR16 TaxID=946334 RepID=UPI000F708C9F|nr:hypothetical protein [Actinoplanes sp. OR16]BBH65476.1 hypothetical protein ACTI_21610 [Actinoplanes sp. OR16]
MTGWGVERGMRAACRSLSIPRGGSPLMPSPSQEAERRPERRAGHIGSRWALRALVIGGLAGAAWLLTGTAAQAADHDGEPAGSLYESASHSVASVAGNEPLVGELLKAAAQPLESESAPKLHRRVVKSILTTAERMLSGPVEVPDEVIYDGSAFDTDLLDEEPRRKSVPSRTSDGPADDRTRPEPAEDVADTVTEPEPDTTASAVAVPPSAGSAVIPPAEPRAALSISAGASIEASHAPRAVPAAKRAKAESRNHVHRRVPAARPAPAETVRKERPVDDGHTPARMNLGTVSGIPASGPGASPEVGPAAVLPARIVNGAVEGHRFPFAADVEARRNDAVAPTVSPD